LTSAKPDKIESTLDSARELTTEARLRLRPEAMRTLATFATSCLLSLPSSRIVGPRCSARLALSELVRQPALVEALPDVDEARARAMLEELEALKVRPVTLAFVELLLGGTWDLVRSVPPAGAELELDGLIDDEDETKEGFRMVAATLSAATLSPGLGTLATAIEWEWARKAVRGTFSVDSAYTLTASGVLQLQRTDAKVDVSADLLPDDAQSLMRLLTALLPSSVCDPHLAKLELTSLDHELMLARHQCARYRGTRELWRRRKVTPTAA
jgi:hypothetical protein